MLLLWAGAGTIRPRSHTCTASDLYANSLVHACAHAHPHSHRNTYFHSDNHSYRIDNAYPHRDEYPHRYFHRDGYPLAYPYLHGYPYPAAQRNVDAISLPHRDSFPYQNIPSHRHAGGYHHHRQSKTLTFPPPMNTFLKDLISAPGLSGHEAPVRSLIAEKWETLSDEMHTTPIGSLHALKRGSAPEPRPKILIATHMDAIGLMVTRLDGAYLHVTEIGGVDERVLPGQRVIVHGRRDLTGIVVQPADRLLPESLHGEPVPMEYLLVDTGLPAGELASLVHPGDLVSFAQPPLELGKHTLAGHSLDNRASVAALTYCLELLQGRDHAWDVWAVATVQEEETLGGALTSAFDLRPQVAIAVDVTFGDGPGSPDYLTFAIGEGIPFNWGPNVHRGVFKRLKETAEALEIPWHTEYAPRHSGTDGMALQIAADAVPTMVVSIPLRYMHTPVEMISTKDVNRVGRLLAEFIAALPADWQPTLDDENGDEQSND